MFVIFVLVILLSFLWMVPCHAVPLCRCCPLVSFLSSLVSLLSSVMSFLSSMVSFLSSVVSFLSSGVVVPSST